MKDCDNSTSKIHISSNLILSKSMRRVVSVSDAGNRG